MTAVKKEKGFTLVEMIMVIVIIAIIAGIAAPLLAVSVQAIGHRISRVDIEESSMIALSRMSREIRRLRDDTSVVIASNSQLEFFDKDNSRIRYLQSGNTLMRGFYYPSTPSWVNLGLADNVQTLRFDYYDDEGTLISAPAAGSGVITNIKKIRIQITSQKGNEIMPVEIWVRPRNLKYESQLFF